MRYLLFFLILSANSLNAQVVNSNNSIVWNPSSYDSKISYTFYAKGLMSGIMEPAELIINNRSSYELFIKVSYTIYDNCGGSKSYTKSETLKAGTNSSSSGAFFSGIDYESACKDITSFGSNLKTKIKDVTVRLISLENITEKEQEEKRKKQEEELRRQREKQEELAKRKLEEERKKDAELKRKNDEEYKRKTEEAASKRKQEDEASAKKEMEDKESSARAITNEAERKQALDKIALDKKETEKRTAEKKVAEKKDTRTDDEKWKEVHRTQCQNVMMAASTKYNEATIAIYNILLWNEVKKLCESYFSMCGREDVSVNNMYEDATRVSTNIIEGTIGAVQDLVADVFSPYTIYGIGYSGINFKPEKYSPTEFQKITFQISGVRKWMNLIGEIGYMQSPNYIVAEYNQVPNSNNIWLPTGKRDTTRLSGLWASFGLGPTIRLFKETVFINTLAQIGALVVGKNYEEEEPFQPFGNFSGGLLIRLGKWGIGADYNYFLPFLKFGEKGTTAKSTDKGGWRYEESFTRPTSIGVRLMYNFNVNK